MNNGLINEDDFVFLIKEHIKRGYSNFVFKGANALTWRYENIVNALKFEGRSSRKAKGFYKADVVLIDKYRNIYPVSIKMHDCTITWESADGSMKDLLHEFVDCYGAPILPNSTKVIVPNTDDIDLEPYVFGDDILNDDGIILVQKFTNNDFIRFNKNTVVVNCSRVFKDFYDVLDDEVYRPCITVKKDRNRNLTDPKAKGYRIEVSPEGHSVNMLDILDQITFK